jgi:predicted Rossmann fold flavoprotein
MAAITCAETYPQASVTILERGKYTLEKVSISGGGRCNVTNHCTDVRELVKNYPRGGKELIGPFKTFGPAETMEWFTNRGVRLKTEKDGRMFPITDSSETIMACLEQSAIKAGVEIRINTRVNDFDWQEDNQKWQIDTARGIELADILIVTPGSSAHIWKILERLGHHIISPVPSLFTFNISDSRLEGLAGISFPRVRVKVSGTKFTITDNLLITHRGLSGFSILKLSAWEARTLFEQDYKCKIQVNFCDLDNLEQTIEELHWEKEHSNKSKIYNTSVFQLPSRFCHRLYQAAGIPEELKWADISKKQMHALAMNLFQAEFTIHGKNTNKEEFVTAGGVDLKEVNFKNFSSKKYPNLFFAGEILDIDALTGGFNFQAAWTGGYIIGSRCLESKD